MSKSVVKRKVARAVKALGSITPEELRVAFDGKPDDYNRFVGSLGTAIGSVRALAVILTGTVVLPDAEDDAA